MRLVNAWKTKTGNLHWLVVGLGVGPAAFVAALLTGMLFPSGAAGIGFEGIHRDSFPVFNNPRMLTASQAEARGVIYARDAVIGISMGGEAKAYPITVMGYHELGNDTLAGVPIAVSW